jgi:hypothetical protein
MTRSGWQDFKSPFTVPPVGRPAALKAVGTPQRARDSAAVNPMEPMGVMIVRQTIGSTPLPTVPCPWCGAPVGVRCTVRGARHKLRLAMRHSRSHPSREVMP